MTFVDWSSKLLNLIIGINPKWHHVCLNSQKWKGLEPMLHINEYGYGDENGKVLKFYKWVHVPIHDTYCIGYEYEQVT